MYDKVLMPSKLKYTAEAFYQFNVFEKKSKKWMLLTQTRANFTNSHSVFCLGTILILFVRDPLHFVESVEIYHTLRCQVNGPPIYVTINFFFSKINLRRFFRNTCFRTIILVVFRIIQARLILLFVAWTSKNDRLWKYDQRNQNFLNF